MEYSEAIYQGATDYFTPTYGSIGYQINPGDFSMAVDPRTANQLGEVNSKINPGGRNVEVQGLMAKNWEAIPDEHLTEINRLAKLTGVTPSLHGPLVEASGIGERGWSELDREGAERQLESAVLRANKLDPGGNIPVTVHSTAQLPDMQPTIKTANGEEIKTLWVINPDTGKFTAIEPQKRYFPDSGEKFTEEAKQFNPEKELKKINQDAWTEQLSGVNRYVSFAENDLNQLTKSISQNKNIKESEANELLSEIGKIDLDQVSVKEFEQMGVKKDIEEYQKAIEHGQIYLREAYRNMRSLFDNTYVRASEEDKKKLKEFADWAAPKIQEGMERDPSKINEFKEIVTRGLKTLGKIESPHMYVPLNDFVVEKSAETFANVAASAYNKFKDKAPVISIENPPAGSGLSRAEDLKKLVEASRGKFVENLQKKGMSEGEAKRVAEKLIGATWDVGHINMIRKFGYDDKDLIKETKTIAPFVKHVHLSDNFGMEHTELPMGMGNVPIKGMLQEIEGAGGKKIRKVIEAGDWFQHFAEKGGGHPFKPSLQNFDSPIYSMYQGPSWGQLGGQGSYYSGMGAINPPIHHTIYGAGLTTLPVDLGGEMPGGGEGRGRFAQS